MKTTYTVEGMGKITLTDNDYLASGGEASIYVKDKTAYKIYNDPQQMLPSQKIDELKQIKHPNVLIPLAIVYEDNKPVGYALEFKKGSYPLCQLFTNSFKQQNNISNEQVNELISQMQVVVQSIHDANCLIVDLNEMNELVAKKFDDVFFIDVDSYQTPSFRATAIMESIRDRTIKANKWNEGSDWFSFAVLATQLWVGIHPFKGSHPDYKNSEWLKRMEKGISIFDPKVSLPKSCNDFSIIPSSHLKWLKQVFVDNARCSPPSMGDIVSVAIPHTFNIISATDAFITVLSEECPEVILNVFNFMGINFLIGKKNIYKGRAKLPVIIDDAKKVLMCESNGVAPVVCILKDGIVSIFDDNGKDVGKIAAEDMMYRNGCIYTVFDGKLIENSFTRFGEKTVHGTRMALSVMDLSTQVFDGVIIQDLLGKKYVTIPYVKGSCQSIHVKELDGLRIIDARSERNVCAIIAEKKGEYTRLVLSFDPSYAKYTIRITHDVSYCNMNLTVMPNGVAVLVSDSNVEVFKGENVKVIDNPPFGASDRMFNVSGGMYYTDGKKLYSVKMKK